MECKYDAHRKLMRKVEHPGKILLSRVFRETFLAQFDRKCTTCASRKDRVKITATALKHAARNCTIYRLAILAGSKMAWLRFAGRVYTSNTSEERVYMISLSR